MSDSEQKELSVRWFLEKFGLAVAPALAYYLAFSYERAYCAKFGIPASLIRPEWTTVLVYFSAVLGIGSTIALFIDSWIESLSKTETETPGQHFRKIYTPFLLLIVLAVMLYFGHWRRWIWVVLPILLGTVADVVASLKGPSDKPFLARLEGPGFVLTGPGSLFGVARKRLSAELFVTFVGVYLAVAISTALGEAEALNQRVFSMPSTTPDYVVVRFYGDRMVCAQIDTGTRKPSKRFQVMTVASDGKMHIESKLIGPLVFD